ncbi:ABC transporter ATP-binding protein [Clostridium sp.]|uniref:ABC transporter ATP-binding protein n=1 Tax=Clostridium sp. TaxID=1506 RepID=UPI002FCA440E
MVALEIKNVSKRFEDKLVLDNVSFTVNKGEIFGLLGPNGAGKSTLINIMTGLLNPNSGEVIVDGYDIRKESIKAKMSLGVVLQDLALIEELNAYDNLQFFGALYGLKGSLLKERINEALEVTGLLESKKQKVKKYSGGMKRRLNIAASIMHHPRILIMDEPTVGVDTQSRNYIFEFIKKISKEWGTTVLYTSHYMEEVEELCSKVFIMDMGKEVAYGEKDAIKSEVFPNNKIIIEGKNITGEIIYNIKELEGVKRLKESEESISLYIDNKFNLSEALKEIEIGKGSISKISYEETKLEDVFLALTGKKLRD